MYCLSVVEHTDSRRKLVSKATTSASVAVKASSSSRSAPPAEPHSKSPYSPMTHTPTSVSGGCSRSSERARKKGARRVRVQLRRVGNHHHHPTENLLLSVDAREREHAHRGVNLPPLGRRVRVDERAHLRSQVGLELGFGHEEVVEELVGEGGDVGLVDEAVDKVERAALDRHVAILDAVDDCVAVALDRSRVHGHNLGQRVERHVADVIIAVREEPSEDIDGKDAKAADRFDAHDCLHALVENGVAGVAGAVDVGRNLRQHVAHRIRSVGVALAENVQQAQHLHLQEWVAQAPDVVLR
mmetsp:Transcript_8985/g.29522  ORF Transcript_8985/g.29522 Transcript_8985/m.29522 type:complete len:299 (+) Transcript_8985:303-1199(+)